MKDPFQIILNLSRCLILGLFFQGTALAQQPGQNSPQIQPALILALALTSLVLFCFYIFQKNRREKKGRDMQNLWANDIHPVQTRLHETHKALNSLLSHPCIPMAKTALEQGRIIEATPALYQTLGYTKKTFLKENPEKLGLLPTEEKDIRSLVENGWAQSSAPLFQKTTGKRFNCCILNIATHIEGCPMVLSIIPNLTEDHMVSPACDTPQYTENLR